MLPVLAMAVAVLLFVSMIFAQRRWEIVFLMGVVVATWGALCFHLDHMDRFVVAGMRVFRVHGFSIST
ncbi:hypothetical protein [Cutibacterium modestum]|uniref:hypothetical protein n=1 Tax=Cutibacterium modestum TaxID=2559073 RepID=UPI000206FD58|nr:hypothetical protein [Cutibacterium modestum]EGG27141.1 hypothetical protein PA08_1384 [Cutibacterium modestum P08]MCP2376257.1 hypothetical protein [Cutibacterium modestum 28N]MCP2378296.1 hypothetical protein [Cutibacterium modestum 31N]MCP2381176.1 hypothetical protein [Cutibacterium modestum 30N]